MAYVRLGDLLLSAGVITQDQLRAALESQKLTHQRLGDTLISSGVISERQLCDALQLQLGVDFIDLSSTPIPMEMAKLVPQSIAQEHNVIPVKLVGDELYIAMCDPLDFVAQEKIKAASHRRVVPMIATRRAMEQALANLYGSQGAAEAIEQMKREVGAARPTVQSQQAANEVGNENAPTIKFVNNIIERAVLSRASDIHLEPQDGEMVVRMRVDGLLRRVFTVPSDLQETVISRLKVMGGMNISERKIPQDGHALVTVREHNLDLRINSLPTIYGEKVVIRLLDKTGRALTPEAIGLVGRDMDKYQALQKNNSGVILIVGPTGSGKSTTLCTMITGLCREEVNIITLEDPVEYNINGVNQCQINEKTGMTFATGLRAILRQDPDIIGVGEIRDGETATIAIRAAITGHLVLSTLHTNDAVSAVQRLVDVGVEPFMISSALRGVISQRLVRKICPRCKKPYKPTEDEAASLGFPSAEGLTFYKGEGCSECNRSGYSGRSGVFEIFMINSKLRQLISDGVSHEELLAAARANGMETLRERCRDMVLRGVTSAREAMRAVASTAEE